jgi:hypothetical protein
MLNDIYYSLPMFFEVGGESSIHTNIDNKNKIKNIMFKDIDKNKWNFNTITFSENDNKENEDDDKFINKIRNEFDTREYNKNQTQIALFNNGIKETKLGSKVLDLSTRYKDTNNYNFFINDNSKDEIKNIFNTYLLDIKSQELKEDNKKINNCEKIIIYKEKYNIKQIFGIFLTMVGLFLITCKE